MAECAVASAMELEQPESESGVQVGEKCPKVHGSMQQPRPPATAWSHLHAVPPTAHLQPPSCPLPLSLHHPLCPLQSDHAAAGRGRPSNLLAGLQQALRGAETVDADRKRLKKKNLLLKSRLVDTRAELRQLRIEVRVRETGMQPARGLPRAPRMQPARGPARLPLCTPTHCPTPSSFAV